MNMLIKTFKFTRIGDIFFKLGILLLPSAFFLSVIFLFFSLIIACFKSKNLLKDNWNIPFILCSIVMVIVCLISNLNLGNFYDLNLDKSLNWLGLTNWIPMFWIFWSSQYYLEDSRGRELCSLCLVFGTIPILISGFGQYFFEWYGPFKILNGAIVWYQRSSENSFQSLTGPFNNVNIAGTWLAVIFPLCCYFIVKYKKISLKKIIYFFIGLATFIATILTYSRNAILNISLASILLMGVNFKIIFLLIGLITIASASIFIFEIPLDFFNFMKDKYIISGFIPGTNKISGISNFWRIKIWSTAISNIMKNPLLGWGASSFSALYYLKFGNEDGNPGFQHTHNIVLEMAHNYGIIVSLILFGTIFLLIIKSKPDLSKNKLNINLINKFWWISTLIILLMHLSDIPYYDGRISILFWIMIAGTRCILRESDLTKIKLNSSNN